MPLARAFTLRRKESKPSKAQPSVTRSFSMRYPDKPVNIRSISSPVALLSTTNMLSYNAPDVSAVRAQRKASDSVSSASSHSSAEDSDTSSTWKDTTLTDASSIASTSSPASSPKADRNTKSSSYFSKPEVLSVTPAIPPRFSRLSRSSSTIDLRRSHTLLSALAEGGPDVPQRAPSHSKSAHELLARKRSLQTMSRSPSISSIASSSREVRRSSIEFFSRDISDPAPPASPASNFAATSSMPAAPAHHPFVKELMQLDEITEEFGEAIRDVEREGDLKIMKSQGLVCFCAEDYLKEILPFSSGFSSTYMPHHEQMSEVAWI